MSASVCAIPDCNKRPGSVVKCCHYRTLLCPEHRREVLTHFKLGTRDSLTEAQFNEFVALKSVNTNNQTTDSNNESDCADNASEEESGMQYSDAEEEDTSNEIFTLSEEEELASESNRSDTSDSDASDSNTSDTDNPVMENNDVEMNASNDTTVNDAVEETIIVHGSTNDVSSKDEASGSTSSDTSDAEIDSGSTNDDQSTAPVNEPTESSAVKEDTVAEPTVPADPATNAEDDNNDAVHVEFSEGWDDLIYSDDDDNDSKDVPASPVKNNTDQLDIKPAPFVSSDSDDEHTEKTVVPAATIRTAPIHTPTNQADAVNALLGDDSDSDDESDNMIDTTGKVLWDCCAHTSNKREKRLIAHKDITPALIKDGFYEIVGSRIQGGDKVYTQKYIRLFFDIDIKEEHAALSLYNVVIERMNRLKTLFGDCSISAYSNVKSIASTVGCKHRPKANKALSLHIVFYESRLLIADLMALFDERSYIIDKTLYDTSVYTIGKRRVFRHHQSPHSPKGIKGYNPDGSHIFVRYQKKDGNGKPIFNEDGTPKLTDDGKYCPGSIIGNKSIQTQILQPTGSEKLISLDDVHKSGVWFDLQQNVSFDDVKVRVSKNKIRNHMSSGYVGKLVDTKRLNAIMKEVNAETVESADNDNDAGIDHIYSVSCLKHLLDCFTPDFVNLQHVFWLVIVSGPYDKKTLKSIVKEWYWKGSHSTPNGDANYIDTNYVTVDREVNDMWFYCAIKHLPASLQDAFKSKYAKRSVNTSVKFDVWDDFGLSDIRLKIINNKYSVYRIKTVTDVKARKNALKLSSGYGIKKVLDEDGVVQAVTINRFPVIQFGQIISDLRRCFVVVDSTPLTYIFKDLDGATGKKCIERTTHANIACNKLRSINIEYLDSDMLPRSIDLWTLINHKNNSHYLTYLAAEFYSTNPDVFSYYYAPYQRCAYDSVDHTKTDYHNMNSLERWLHHVNSVICAGDEEAIRYIHGWIARPLKNPLMKNKTAVILKDRTQGTGKSWFAEIVAKLHGRFGNANVGDMKHICGNFNALVENKTLMVVNELEDADNNMYYNDSRLKDLITEETVSIEHKGVDPKGHPIFANFIFISNNETPIRVTDKDRRYVVLRPASIHNKDDFDYWEDRFYGLVKDDAFIAQLYSYYMDLDIGYYNPRAIPKTLALAELIEQSRPRICDFIVDNYELFVEGWTKEYAFDDYLGWCKRNNYQNPGNINTFTNNLSDYIVWTYQKSHGNDKRASRVLPKKRTEDGKRVYCYKLNEQAVERFKTIDNDMSDNDEK